MSGIHVALGIRHFAAPKTHETLSLTKIAAHLICDLAELASKSHQRQSSRTSNVETMGSIGIVDLRAYF